MVSSILLNTNNYRVSSNYFYLIIVICLHTVIWLQVTNDNTLLTIIASSKCFKYSNRIRKIFKQIYLTYRWDTNMYYHSESEWTWE